MQTIALRSSLVVLAALAVVAEIGCSGAPGESSSSNDGDARVAAVQSALEQPTASVTPESVRALAADWQSFQQAAVAFDALLALGASTEQSCLTGTPEAGAVAESAADDVGPTPAYDLACLTGGKVVGRLAFQFEPASAAPDADGGGAVPQRVAVQLQNACAGDTCLTADGFASIAPKAPLGCAPTVTVAITATVTTARSSRTFSFGAEGAVGRSALDGVTVYFDDAGRSLMVQAGDGAGAGGSVLVTGDGQSFECTLAAAGGRCVGATSFTY